MRLPQPVVSAKTRWIALAILCLAFFMDILDVAIVNVALPTIQEDLDFSQQNLAWVVSAYALTYGGLLLLGGRIADTLGRRMIFMTGVTTFAAASLIAGLAWTDTALIAARALQGVGAAMMTPAALSLVVNTFNEGSDRNKALGIWGAVGASGGTMGVLLGGIFTDTIGWEWIFFLNVPVSAAILLATPFFVSESRVEKEGKQTFDVPGATAITGSIALLTYGLIDAESAGWGSAQTITLFVASAVLLGAFIVIERRTKNPLMPFSIFRLRSLTGANVAGFSLGASVFGMIFIVTLYMQQVLGYSPLKTGVAWLTMSLAALISAIVSSQVVTKVGARYPIAVGLTLAAIGFGLLGSIPTNGSYTTDLLPGLLVFGLGLGMAFVAASIGALEDVPEKDSGLASGLINTMQQVGGALGVAVLATLAISRSGDLLAEGDSEATALTGGFSLALYAGVGFALLGVFGALILIRRQPGEQTASELEPASVESNA